MSPQQPFSGEGIAGSEEEVERIPGSYHYLDLSFTQSHSQVSTPQIEYTQHPWIQTGPMAVIQSQAGVSNQLQGHFEQMTMFSPGGQQAYSHMAPMNAFAAPSQPFWPHQNASIQQYGPIPLPDGSDMAIPQQFSSPNLVVPSSRPGHPMLTASSSTNSGSSKGSRETRGRSSGSHTSPSVGGQSIPSIGLTKRKSGGLTMRANVQTKTEPDDDDTDDDDDDDEEDGENETGVDGNGGRSEHKRQRFLARNRVAATRCRQKKKDWMSTLEERARMLSAEQQHLQSTVNGLRQEVLSLKCRCLDHVYCDCKRIREYLGQTVATMTPNKAVYEDARLSFMSNEDAGASATNLMQEAHLLHNPQSMPPRSGPEET